MEPLLDPETMNDYEFRMSPAPTTHGLLLAGLRNKKNVEEKDRIFILDFKFNWIEVTPTGSYAVAPMLGLSLSAAAISYIDDTLTEKSKQTAPDVTASLAFN